MINIQNIGNNEFFKLSIVRYINLAINHPTRVAKAHKDFAKKVNFKGIEFPIKMRDIHKIKKKKKNRISISVFGYENKENHPMYVSKKCCEENHVELLLIGEKEKNTMFYQKFSCIIILNIVEENIFVIII